MNMSMNKSMSMTKSEFASAIRDELRRSGLTRSITTQLRTEIIQSLLRYEHSHSHLHSSRRNDDSEESSASGYGNGNGNDNNSSLRGANSSTTKASPSQAIRRHRRRIPRIQSLEHAAVRSLIMEFLECDGLQGTLSVYAMEGGFGFDGTMCSGVDGYGSTSSSGNGPGRSYYCNYLSRQDCMKALNIQLPNLNLDDGNRNNNDGDDHGHDDDEKKNMKHSSLYQLLNYCSRQSSATLMKSTMTQTSTTLNSRGHENDPHRHDHALRARRDLNRQLKFIQDKYQDRPPGQGGESISNTAIHSSHHSREAPPQDDTGRSTYLTSPSYIQNSDRGSLLEAKMFAFQKDIERQMQSKLEKAVTTARNEVTEAFLLKQEAYEREYKTKQDSWNTERSQREEQLKSEYESRLKDVELQHLKQIQEMKQREIDERNKLETDRRSLLLEEQRVNHIHKMAGAKLEFAGEKEKEIRESLQEEYNRVRQAAKQSYDDALQTVQKQGDFYKRELEELTTLKQSAASSIKRGEVMEVEVSKWKNENNELRKKLYLTQAQLEDAITSRSTSNVQQNDREVQLQKEIKLMNQKYSELMEEVQRRDITSAHEEESHQHEKTLLEEQNAYLMTQLEHTRMEKDLALEEVEHLRHLLSSSEDALSSIQHVRKCSHSDANVSRKKPTFTNSREGQHPTTESLDVTNGRLKALFDMNFTQVQHHQLQVMNGAAVNNKETGSLQMKHRVYGTEGQLEIDHLRKTSTSKTKKEIDSHNDQNETLLCNECIQTDTNQASKKPTNALPPRSNSNDDDDDDDCVDSNSQSGTECHPDLVERQLDLSLVRHQSSEVTAAGRLDRLSSSIQSSMITQEKKEPISFEEYINENQTDGQSGERNHKENTGSMKIKHESKVANDSILPESTIMSYEDCSDTMPNETLISPEEKPLCKDEEGVVSTEINEEEDDSYASSDFYPESSCESLSAYESP